MSLRTRLIAAYAVAAIAATFVEAIYRLGHRAAVALDGRVDLSVALAVAISVALFTWGEGYRALQRRFVPHVLARAFEAGEHLHGCFPVLLAPVYALGLYRAERAERARAWAGIGLIVCAVLAVRQVPDPWRGVIDAGVAAALSWGCAALLAGLARLRRQAAAQ